MKIVSVNKALKNARYYPKMSYKLCHWPNGSIAHFVKNKGGYCLLFDTSVNGYMTKIARKFMESKNEWK